VNNSLFSFSFSLSLLSFNLFPLPCHYVCWEEKTKEKKVEKVEKVEKVFWLQHFLLLLFSQDRPVILLFDNRNPTEKNRTKKGQ